MMNSSIPTNEDGEDDSPTSQACFREIGIAAVAAALCCARLPPPADERVAKDARELSWTDLLEEQPWFGVQ
jgi:hypothetical protein